MQTRTITVTEASRNFADCVNRARYQGVTFILQRNGVPVARIVPEAQKSAKPIAISSPPVNESASIAQPLERQPNRSLW
jgi:prevent-host-death family protein